MKFYGPIALRPITGVMTCWVVVLFLCHVATTIAQSTAPQRSIPAGSCVLQTTDSVQQLSMACNSSRVRFLAIGDWGEKRESQAIRSIRDGILHDADQADFIVALGDNFYSKGVKNVRDSRWISTWIDRFQIGSRLKLPWLALLGNHDHYGNAQAQIDYMDANLEGSKYWVMPEQFFSVNIGSATSRMKMVFTDTETAEESDMEWVARELNDPSAAFILALGHHHIYSRGRRGDNRDSEMRDLNALLRAFPQLKAYICGHEHDIQYLKADDIDYFMLGGGGRRIKDDDSPGTRAEVVYYARQYGYALYEIDMATGKVLVTYKVYDSDGRRVDTRFFERDYIVGA